MTSKITLPVVILIVLHWYKLLTLALNVMLERIVFDQKKRGSKVGNL